MICGLFTFTHWVRTWGKKMSFYLHVPTGAPSIMLMTDYPVLRIGIPEASIMNISRKFDPPLSSHHGIRVLKGLN